MGIMWMLYIDFAKAFDKLDHGILLHKNKALGICGKLEEWLYSFLTDREQRVIVQRELSDASSVVSGVS